MSGFGCKTPGSSEEPPSDNKGPFKIGAVLSLTGTYAPLGESAKKAIDLEVGRINAQGGVNGREIQVLIEDDGTDEAKSLAAASRLIDREEVLAIIGASGTGQSMSMRSELNRAGVAQISLAGGTVITDDFDSLVFQTPWSNTLVVPYILDAMVARNVSKVALLSDSGGYGKDGRAVILQEAPKLGLEIVSDQTFNPGDTDMSTQLTKVRSSDADAILLWNAGKEAAIIVRNATDLGLNLPMFGGSGQARLEFIEGAGEAGNGFVFATGRSLVPDNWEKGSAQHEAVSKFAEEYKAKYGEPPDIFAGHAFDAMAIVVAALERTEGMPTPAELRDAIEQTSGIPGFGGTFTFSANDHNGLGKKDVALYVVRDGKWETAE
ncbi:MAG: ABC transporter substrate-binding protein [Coriobacteriia bacterium]|nr:ABC transporter substrate-binding protein [Coriobacteriia bacterium]